MTVAECLLTVEVIGKFTNIYHSEYGIIYIEIGVGKKNLVFNFFQQKNGHTIDYQAP